jgi:hypothetical protein
MKNIVRICSVLLTLCGITLAYAEQWQEIRVPGTNSVQYLLPIPGGTVCHVTTTPETVTATANDPFGQNPTADVFEEQCMRFIGSLPQDVQDVLRQPAE